MTAGPVAAATSAGRGRAALIGLAVLAAALAVPAPSPADAGEDAGERLAQGPRRGPGERARREPAERPPPAAIPYFDVHNHLNARWPTPGGREEQDYDGAAAVALQAMDALGIRKMLLMPPPFPPGFRHAYDAEDFLPLIRKRPDRFGFLAGGGTLNPMIHQAARAGGEVDEALRRRFEERAEELVRMGALGFGEMTALHFSFDPATHPFLAAPPDHPLFLLLADIAARRDVAIDLHMEAVREAMPLPEGFVSPPNPRTVAPTIPAFERLLAHNPKARIVWAHAGWDNTGDWTTALSRELLARHPNLFMSIKISPESRPEHRPLRRGEGIAQEWLEMIAAFPDRFVIGTDQFFASPRAPRQIGPTRVGETARFLSLLPPELARKVGSENPRRIYKIAD
ncbi:MAG: amidohydrolase family protein [Proteobacteria bacterium]|nr:amidohydrolase family protein [Pseudomonadota bacterium]